jgi:hypothetical protein
VHFLNHKSIGSEKINLTFIMLILISPFKISIMTKSQDAKKNVKKEPAKTTKQKKADKIAKKANKRD